MTIVLAVLGLLRPSPVCLLLPIAADTIHGQWLAAHEPIAQRGQLVFSTFHSQYVVLLGKSCHSLRRLRYGSRQGSLCMRTAQPVYSFQG